MPRKRAIAAVLTERKVCKLCYHDTTCYSILTILQGALQTLEAPPSFQRLADRVRDDREMSVDTDLKASTAQRLNTS